MDRYEQQGFPPDINVKAPLDPTKEAIYANPHRLYQAAVAYAEQQAFTDAERCFHELVTRRDATYEADSRTWLEIIDAYKDLLEMDHPATRRQFEKHKEAYQKRNFIDGIFDPRGLLGSSEGQHQGQKEDGKLFAQRGHELLWRDLDYTTALTALNRAVELGERTPKVYADRGRAFTRLGQDQQAQLEYQQALQFPTVSVDDYAYQGYAHARLKQNDQALQLLNHVVVIAPQHELVYFFRGYTHYNLEQYQRAIADFDRAIQLRHDYADAYYNRGSAYYNLQQYQRAIQDYDRAIQINPDYADAYVGRGLAYSNLQQYQRAIEDFDRAIQLRHDFAVAYYNRGIAYDDLKQYQRAIEDYDRAIQIKHDYALAYNNRGVAYENLGNMTQAKADYCKALQLNPSNESAKSNLKRKGWVC
jgi:tetratricopeptide (TPR) repeat protein